MITKEILVDFAKDLPIIRPIKEFIHLNLLLPYQHLDFWDALKEVSFKLDAMPLLDLDFYREKLSEGTLSRVILEKKINQIQDENLKSKIKEFIYSGKFDFVQLDQRSGHLHSAWNNFLDINISELADGMLIKWLSMYLDQGIGHWEMPGADSKNFYECVRDLLKESLILPDPFKKELMNEFFLNDPMKVINYHLEFLCDTPAQREEYCRESILTLRGWAGIIYTIENNPDLLPFKRKIRLEDFLAVKLILEKAWILEELEGKRNLRPKFSDLNWSCFHPLMIKEQFLGFKILQESLEETTYEKLLHALLNKPGLSKQSSHFQIVFCMDDRECSLRRHLEEIGPRIETFGTAGHFGIEAMYQHPTDPFPKKHCPAPVPAKFFLEEKWIKKNLKNKHRGLQFHEIQPSGNIFLDWFFSYINSFTSVLNLLKNLFFPLLGVNKKNILEIELETKLLMNREESSDHAPFLSGYTHEEMAQLVFNQLRQIGLIDHFAPIVMILGHTSTSSNNPYFATYGCGACSGRSGAPNARAFAHMANDSKVRDILSNKYGIHLPHSTYFLAAVHDTCKDTIKIFNWSDLPKDLSHMYQQFKNYLSLGLINNAHERCERFKLVSYAPLKKNAQKEVLRRSLSLFETRPELGHTNVAFALVAKRDFSLGLNLSRRSFLQSYDASLDPEGLILAQVLGAVIPVCSGISLDYFFSRVDNQRFGAGSKLPQNVVGNLGMSHGTESDLLFGLPFQMIDQHQSLRLLVLVQHTPDIALRAVGSNPLVKQIVYNNWIYFACYSEIEKKFYFFDQGEMKEKKLDGIYG